MDGLCGPPKRFTVNQELMAYLQSPIAQKLSYAVLEANYEALLDGVIQTIEADAA